MANVKKHSISREGLVRWLAVSNLVLTVLLGWLGCGRLSVECLVCNMYISLGMLSMITPFYKVNFVELMVCVAMLAVSVGMAVLSFTLRMPNAGTVLHILSFAVVFVSVGMSSVVRIMLMLNNIDFLARRMTGWEIILGSSHYVCLFLSFHLFWIVHLLMALGQDHPLWLDTMCVVLCAFPLVFLFVRSITAHDGHLLADVRVQVPGVSSLPVDPMFEENASISEKVLFKRLCDYMDAEKPFLAGDFSLENLYRELATNKTYLSKVINKCTGLNFKQFANNYRIRYSMAVFKENPDLKVRELSDLSGFNSSVSFNMAFKLFSGLTPGEWCRDYKDALSRVKRPSTSKEQERKRLQESS